MGDYENAVAACREAQEDGEEISHAAARVIASMFHMGGGSASTSLSTTGAILRGDSELLRELFPTWMEKVDQDQDRFLADMMGAYLRVRVARGDTGPVTGWSQLWL